MTDTKDRIVGATAELFRLQGYTGTGVMQIVAEAGAPFGSLYHFFPGGKEQLGEEAIRRSGAAYGQLVPFFFDSTPDPAAATRALFEAAAETLEATDYADACPIATVALEVASTNEPLRLATADVFQSWLDGWATYLERRGRVDPERARVLAMELLGAMEGAFVLCRALRSPEPMQVAGAAAVERVREALGADGAAPPRR